MKEDAFGRPGYGHRNVDAHAAAVENDVLAQIDHAASENPDNETDMNKRDVEADKAFEDSSLNPAIDPDSAPEDVDNPDNVINTPEMGEPGEIRNDAPEGQVVGVPDEDEDEVSGLSHVARTDNEEDVYLSTASLENADESRSNVEER